MRLILRLIFVWLVIMPISAYFGFPHLVKYLQDKTQLEAYNQCITQTNGMPSVFDPTNPEIAAHYCRCVRDGVTVTRDDVFLLIRKQPTTALNARVSKHVEGCSVKLDKPDAKDAQVIYF